MVAQIEAVAHLEEVLMEGAPLEEATEVAMETQTEEVTEVPMEGLIGVTEEEEEEAMKDGVVTAMKNVGIVETVEEDTTILEVVLGEILIGSLLKNFVNLIQVNFSFSD